MKMLSLRSSIAALAVALLFSSAEADEIDFGDNASSFSQDGQCDDRRFRGEGAASQFDWEDATHDATDCRSLYGAGKISLWIAEDAIAATDCDRVDFGSNASKYAHDGVCDDPRFEGWGAAETLLAGDREADASDCRRLCAFGLIGLRDY
jgi:hypothetical protein